MKTEHMDGVNCVYKGGKLRIWINIDGPRDVVHLLKLGPVPRPCTRRGGGQWRAGFCAVWKYGGPFSPPEFEAEVQEPIANYLEVVPAQHFAFLSMASHSPALLDLSRHDLALAWWLSNLKMFRPRVRAERARLPLARGRKQVLRLVGSADATVLGLQHRVVSAITRVFWFVEET